MSEILSENELNPSQDTNQTINQQAEVATETPTSPSAEKAIESKESASTDSPTNEGNQQPIDKEANSETEAPQNSDEKIDTNADNKEKTTKKAKEYNNPKFEAIFEQLKTVKENNGTIEVAVKERIKGGLRCYYEEMPLFLPASRFAIKRNPSEQSMLEAIGKTLEVNIHELQEDATKRKTVIVSRKKVLEEKYWDTIKVGDEIEGPITSIAEFGIFIDVNGVEGLAHISRLKNRRVEDIKKEYKKGQVLKARIIEVNKNDKRIGLSTKEYDDSPWKGIDSEFTDGTKVTGIVRRITDFGVYVELKPGVDGLCRTNEISWTLRYKDPNEVFTANEEREFLVVNTNESRHTVTLSLKRLTENPWQNISDKYPAKTVVNGTIKYLLDQGAVVNINNEVDGFMPRSKMRFLPKGANNPGDVAEMIVDNIDIEKESIIVIPVNTEKEEFKPKEKSKDSHSNYGNRERYRDNSEYSSSSSDSVNVTLQDLLSDAMKKNLMNS